MIVVSFFYKRKSQTKEICIIFLSHNQKRIVKKIYYNIFKTVFDDEHDTKNYLINRRSITKNNYLIEEV